MERKFFGKSLSGDDVNLYTLENECAKLTVMDFGLIVVGFEVYGRDIIGGFDTLDDYIKDDSHQGGTIGRVANRIGGASFEIDGAIYNLPKNDGENCLHGGIGFDRRMWTLVEARADALVFSYTSADGEEGFPANLDVTVTMTLKDSTLIISYEATPDGKTPVALTNHSYFNLDGFGGNIKDHTARIYADKYTEVSEDLIPNGKRPSVLGTVFDFQAPHRIGERLSDDFIGYDHNFLLSPSVFEKFLGISTALAAEVWNKDLKLSVYTDQPGIQFYIGNFLGNGPDFKGGVKQVRHGAFCLETQTEPNCINHGEGFYDKGEVYRHICVYKVEKI